MRRSCSDSLLTASHSDGVFGSDISTSALANSCRCWAQADVENPRCLTLLPASWLQPPAASFIKGNLLPGPIAGEQLCSKITRYFPG